MGKGSAFANALAQGLNGYVRGTMARRDMDRQDERDTRDREEYDARKAERDRLASDRVTLANAAKPMAVETPNDVTMDDEGNQMPAVPAYRVGANRYETPQLASAAAEAGNTPEAANARIAQAYRETGRPGEAVSLENASLGVKANKLAISAAEAKAAQEKYARDAASAMQTGGWQGAAKFLTDSKADGNDYHITPDGKGKVIVQQVNRETGQARPIGSFEDSEAGKQDAFIGLMSAVKPEQMLEHNRWKREQERRGSEFKETKRLEELRLGESIRHNKVQESHSAATAGNSRRQLELAEKTFKKQSLEGQVETIESALGRKLSGTERENTVKKLAGIGTDEGSIDKFASDLVKEAVKAGTMTAEEAPAARVRIMGQIGGAKAQEKIRSGLTRARAEGKMDEAVRELRAKGLTVDEIKALGGEIAVLEPKTPAGKAMRAAEGIPGGGRIVGNQFVPATAAPQGAEAPVSLSGARLFGRTAPVPGAPGGVATWEGPTFEPARNVEVTDPSVYDRNFRR